MKIIYSAGNIFGANQRMQSFIEHCDFQIKTAAFYNQDTKNIDWCLDSLYYNIKHSDITKEIGIKFNGNADVLSKLLDDVILFDPDLIITDYEFVLAYIANFLGVKLISCSPLNLLPCIKNRSRIRLRFDPFKNASEHLVYSGFGNLENATELPNGFSWVTPYESDYQNKKSNLQNALYAKKIEISNAMSDDIWYKISNNKNFCISIDPSIKEQVINSMYCEQFNIATNIGKINNKRKDNKSKFDKAIEFKQNLIRVKEKRKLHEIVYENSI